MILKLSWGAGCIMVQQLLAAYFSGSLLSASVFRFHYCPRSRFLKLGKWHCPMPANRPSRTYNVWWSPEAVWTKWIQVYLLRNYRPNMNNNVFYSFVALISEIIDWKTIPGLRCPSFANNLRPAFKEMQRKFQKWSAFDGILKLKKERVKKHFLQGLSKKRVKHTEFTDYGGGPTL